MSGGEKKDKWAIRDYQGLKCYHVFCHPISWVGKPGCPEYLTKRSLEIRSTIPWLVQAGQMCIHVLQYIDLNYYLLLFIFM